MGNHWKVIWTTPQGKKTLKRFDEIKDAVQFRATLTRTGITAFVVSAVKAYGPKSRPKAGPRPGHRYLWCPYCIDWRIFHYRAVTAHGFRAPAALRCTVCTISDADFFVRKYNGMVEVVSDDKIKKGFITLDRS
jgi:hypothetical protein